MNKPLSEALVSSTIVAFVKVGALYDNLYDVSQLWLTSENCESLYPKTIALLIKQTYRYGTEKEISLVDELCSALEYDNNFLVQMVRCQAKILHRDNNQKKSLTEEDVSQILKVRNALGKSKHALKIYYESYILFFAKYCTMAMVQLILKEMRKDEIPISKFAYDAVVQHYVSSSKFVLLSQFMQKFVSSPYIYDQCRYIEKSLSRQLKGSGASAESIRMALEKLRGLIGDIQIRLDKDEVDIRVLIRDSFRMLSDWVEMSRKQDERKA
ncbi:hypothetical protein OY671_000483 [Metschnikowia pulcherrima]|nr:hypothetical protein OY671_000483 [Metschnikowia pulcherrima]